MARQLGYLETRLFAYTQMRRLRALRTGDLTNPLRISPQQERELLTRLSKSGLIAQIRRGLYLVPPRLPLGGKWNPDDILAINTLLEDQHGQYQICGPRAFNRYGFDDQIPAGVCIYNNRLSGQRYIGAMSLTLIKVGDQRLGAVDEVRVSDGSVAVYSSRVRSLLDAVYDWSRFDTLPRAYAWIRRDLSDKKISIEELLHVTLRYGNQGTIRRIGVLLERVGTPGKLLSPLQKALSDSISLIAWAPNAPKRGTINRRWGVIIND